MRVIKNKTLKDLNQYGVDAKSKYFVELHTPSDISSLQKSKYLKEKGFLILGEGNNILFTKDFDGLIIKPSLKGKKIVKEDENTVHIEICSGENWDEFVRWSVQNNYQGIENLVDIPSSIGGAVSQNIAAYGQNIMDVVHSIDTINLLTGERKTFSNKECEYTYRNSIFKSLKPNTYLIISATLILKKVYKELETSYHERKARYGSLEDELKSFAKEPYTIKDVMQAVINQRSKKLPSIDEYGTCGCVFENPTVSKEKYLSLCKVIPELQSYPVEKLQYSRKVWSEVGDNYVKIPAGRIIDELKWRGKWEGHVGVHKDHALCVVTNRKASGKEILNFISSIKDDVKKKYDVDLKYEINII